MRTTLWSFGLVLFLQTGFSQNNSEVYVCNLNFTPTGALISQFANASNDPGYDNQPFFASDNHLIFAGNNNGQTDIIEYKIDSGVKSVLGGQLGGGEYSPQTFPTGEGISAVRLDTTGLQRLYRYDLDNNKSTVLIDDLVVAYYTHFDSNTIVGCYIQDNGLNLFVFKKDENKSYTLLKDVGRSFAKVPGQNSVSYTVENEQKNQDIYLLDMETYESFFVAQLPIGVQDYIWLDDSRILIGSRSSLFVFDTFGDGNWEKLADLSDQGIDNITRLAVSPSGKKIALSAIPKK